MDRERNTIIRQLEECEKVRIEKVFFAEQQPLPQVSFLQNAMVPRLILPLSGRKEISFAENNNMRTVLLTPGNALYIPLACWSLPLWSQSHEMVSIVFRKEIIRVIYINFKQKDGNRLAPEPDCAFHFGYPQDNITSSLINVLNKTAKTNHKSQRFLELMINALLNYVRESIINTKNNKFVSKSFMRWRNIQFFLEDNFSNDISRSMVAEHFKMHPNYLSYLFQKYGDESFNEYINGLKLEYSSHLLKNTSATLDEISEMCAFNYTSYFIRVFKRTYGVTPNQYRCQKK